jgi:hypothetical protein
LSSAGIDLKMRIKNEACYFRSMQTLQQSRLTAASATTKGGFVPSKDKFIKHFLIMYRKEKLKPADQQNMLVGLMEAYIAKASGNRNPVMHAKVTNLCVAIHAMSPKSYGMMSANLGLLSLRQVRRLGVSRRDPPVISRNKQDMMTIVTRQIASIRHRFNNPSMRVAMSLGVDATVNVKAFCYLASHNVIVGGASPNHCYL